MLRWAQSITIPLALGLLISYALSPFVSWMAKLRIPRWVSAAILLVLMVVGLGALTFELGSEGAYAIGKLPESIEKARASLQQNSGSWGTLIGSFKDATDAVEKAITEVLGATSTGKGDQDKGQPIKVEQSSFSFHQVFWMGSTSAMEWMWQITLNLFLIYFLLSSGELFKRKIVKITGETFAAKRVTVQILDEINSQIQRYILVQLLLSVIVFLLSWITFKIIGLENATFWAALAGGLHLIPYLGPAIVVTGTGLVGFLQFGSLQMFLVVAGSSLVISTIVGMLIMPWLTSRALRMNAGATFITLLIWSWIWGVWGLLLGTPIVMAVKTICDHVDNLKSFGELLGD